MKTPRQTLREKKARLSYLIESELEKAELVIAIKAITDKLQDMAEDLAKVEADEIMPMQDALRTAFGPQVADSFSQTATGKIRELVQVVGDAKNAISDEIARLEKSVNGEPTNDMAMPEPEAPVDDLGAEPDLGAGPDLGDDAGVDAMGGMSAPDSELPSEPMTAAGRAKKESAAKRGRRLVEYKSVSFDANIANLSHLNSRAGALALQIADMIEAGRLDGGERSGLASVLSHMAAFAGEPVHWIDPDEKVERALQQARVDIRLPEVRSIVQKMKKLAHAIGFHHDATIDEEAMVMPSMGFAESKNLDVAVLNAFRRRLAETLNPGVAARFVAKKFDIDVGDVVSIIREAKSVGVKKKVADKAKPQANFKKRLSVAKPVEEAASKKPWHDLMDKDTAMVSEAVPQKPKTPGDLRNDRAAEQQAKDAAVAPAQAPTAGGKPAPAAGTPKAPQQRQPGQQPSNTTKQAVPAIFQPKGTPAPGATKPVQSGNPVQAPADQAAQVAPPIAPGNRSIGKQRDVAANFAASELKIPGKVQNSGNVADVTLMSKPDQPFPKPTPPFNSTSGAQVAGQPVVAEGRRAKR